MLRFKADFNDRIFTRNNITDFAIQGNWLNINLTAEEIPPIDGQFQVDVINTIEDQADWDTNTFFWDSQNNYWDDIIALVTNEVLTTVPITVTTDLERGAYTGAANIPVRYEAVAPERDKYTSDQSAGNQYESDDESNDGNGYRTDGDKSQSYR